jgi:integrase
MVACSATGCNIIPGRATIERMIDKQPTLFTAPVIEANNPRTKSAYNQDLTDLLAFLRERNAATEPPFNHDLVAKWIDAKHAGGNQYSTIRRRLSSLVALYKQKRLRDPRKDPAIAAAWERVVQTRQRREDKPLAVTETGVRRMLHQMDGEFGALALPDPRTKLSYLRDRAIILIEHHGALTRGEVASLLIDNIVRATAGSGIRLKVNPSGLMPDSDGSLVWVSPDRTRTVDIPRADNPDFCAVTALNRWFVASKIEGGFAFRGIRATGHLTDSISPTVIADMHKFRSAGVADLGGDPISPHSLRRGVVATMSGEGQQLPDIQARTGLKTLDSVADVIAEGRRLGTAVRGKAVISV